MTTINSDLYYIGYGALEQRDSINAGLRFCRELDSYPMER